MCALGEMATFIPHRKGFAGYASRFVDPARTSSRLIQRFYGWLMPIDCRSWCRNRIQLSVRCQPFLNLHFSDIVLQVQVPCCYTQ